MTNVPRPKAVLLPPVRAIGGVPCAKLRLIFTDFNLDVGKATKCPHLCHVPNAKLEDTVAMPLATTVSMSKTPIAVLVCLARLRIKKDWKYAINVKVGCTGK